jgi:hypothetical protein
VIDTRGLLLALAAAAAGCGRTPPSAVADEQPLPGDGTVGPDRPVALAKAMGIDLLQPAAFECKPVRKDESVAADEFPVPRPPFSKDIDGLPLFPCTRCHDKPDDFNPKQRTLTLKHTDIKLNHGPHEQWCYDCHNPSDRDHLRLASGRLIPFERSYELCGQCHNEKLRDWRLGIHGRRTGCWNGQRAYLLCVNCHNQHSPHFAPREPLPRPFTPDEVRAGHYKEATP